MRVAFFICSFILSLHSIAQDANQRPARDSFTLVMPVDKESFYESHIPSVPFIVGPNILQLYPGDTVFIEVEQKNGAITALKSVKENKNRDKTLEISFIQIVSEEKHGSMVLMVKNPFKQDLIYEALIQTMKSGNWTPTSIVPVKAGLTGFEMWPDVIISVALAEWKFL